MPAEPELARFARVQAGSDAHLQDITLELLKHLRLDTARDDAIQAQESQDRLDGRFLVDENADRVLLRREVDAGDEICPAEGQ